jgi:hypothetical protein
MVFINVLLGAGVLTYLDTADRRFYAWFKTGPVIGQFVALILWPVMAYFMIKEKRKV